MSREAAGRRPATSSAASGLVRTGGHIYVAADDERELAVFPAAGDAPGRLVRFLPGELPADPEERKRDKPDCRGARTPAADPDRRGRPAGARVGLQAEPARRRAGGISTQRGAGG